MRATILACGSLSYVIQCGVAYAQQCPHVAGNDWRVMDEADMVLSQNPSTGSFFGSANPDYCQSGWSVTGQFNATTGKFDFTAVNPIQPVDYFYGCTSSLLVEGGNLVEPGCNVVDDGDTTNDWGYHPGVFYMDKSCDGPTGEYSSAQSYGTTPGYSTELRFNVMLTGSGNAYTGRTWRQTTDSSYSAFDSCNFAGGPSPWVSLAQDGQTGTISEISGVSYQDAIGRSDSEIVDIRTSGILLPCGNQFGVMVSLSCSSSSFNKYDDFLIGTAVDATHVGVFRDGASTVPIQWP